MVLRCTHSLTHSLTHPLTHSLTHSLTYSLTYSLIQNLVDLIYRTELNRDSLDAGYKLNIHATSREESCLNYIKTSNPYMETKS